jgi:hypothetical protein
MCHTSVFAAGFFAARAANGRSSAAASVTSQVRSASAFRAATVTARVRPSLSVKLPRLPVPPVQCAAVRMSHFPSVRRGPMTVAVQPALPKRSLPIARSGPALPGGFGSGGTGPHPSTTTESRLSSTTSPPSPLVMTSSSTS